MRRRLRLQLLTGDGPVHPFDEALRERVVANLAGFDARTREPDGLRPAAVAATIVGNADGHACFLLTRRADELRKHAGQWALPGGRLDDGETPEAAALRELREEVGLALPDGAVLGRLDDYPTRSGFVISPVVVWGGHDPALTPDPDEVAAAYAIPLAELDKPEVPRLVDGVDPERPVIQVPLYGHRVHAPTAAILFQLREVALHGRATRVDHYDQPGFAWS